MPVDESQAGSKSVRLGSGSAYTLAGQVIVLAASFAVSILVARNLGPAGKGELTILQQVPAILLVVLNLGISSANTYFVGTGKQRIAVAAGNSLLMASILGAIAAPVVLLFTIGRAAVVDGLPTSAAAIAAVMVAIGLVGSYFSSILSALGRLRAVAAAQVAGALSALTVIVLLAINGRISVTNAVAASACSLVVAVGANLWLTFRLGGRPRVRVSDIHASSAYSLRAHVANLGLYMNYRQDVILLGYLAGAATVGVYSIAVTFAELIWYVPNSIATALLAKSLSSEAEEAAVFTARTSRVAIVLMAAALAVTSLALSPLIRVLYTSAFAAATQAFLILAPGVLVLGVGKILAGYLTSRGRLYPGASLLTMTINLLMNLILVPRLSFNGAALASTISYSALGIYLIRQFSHETGIATPDFLIPTREDAVAVREALLDYLPKLRRSR